MSWVVRTHVLTLLVLLPCRFHQLCAAVAAAAPDLELAHVHGTPGARAERSEVRGVYLALQEPPAADHRAVKKCEYFPTIFALCFGGVVQGDSALVAYCRGWQVRLPLVGAEVFSGKLLLVIRIAPCMEISVLDNWTICHLCFHLHANQTIYVILFISLLQTLILYFRNICVTASNRTPQLCGVKLRHY